MQIPKQTRESRSAKPLVFTAKTARPRFEQSFYDVIVVGAGPAGCAAATIAARGGASVLLLERNAGPTFKVGESLMPESYWTFAKMGVLDRMREAGFVEKHSVQFFSKSGKGSAPFYFDSMNDHESAQTWQVHRAEFDELLIDNARVQGAEVHRGCSVKQVLFEEDRAVGVMVKGVATDAAGSSGAAEPGNSVESLLGARVVVDATGLGNLIPKARAVKRLDYALPHASIFTHFRGAIRDPGKDEGATIILHANDGESWFWYIPLAGDTVSVGVVGRQQTLITGRQAMPHEIFFDEVEKCAEIKRRIANATQNRPMQVLKDFSYKNTEIAGDGWVLIGDAYSFIDPVYSSGVFLALKSGEMAAEAILVGMDKNDLGQRQLASFQEELQRGMAAVLGLVRSFYSPNFSFGGFLRNYPQHQEAVTKILIGDVFESDFSEFFEHVVEYQRAGSDLSVSSGAA